MNVLENKTGLPVEALCQLAQRENNKKRGYLLVNPKQGKHIPVSPAEALRLFRQLAQTVTTSVGEAVTVIGFAETATAIGAAVSSHLGQAVRYLHTTREQLPGCVPLVEFSEAHSHATEQVLYCRDAQAYLTDTDHLLLAEDEITTGKTILNLVRTLRDRHLLRPNVRITALSIINSMTAQDCATFEAEGVEWQYLLKLEGKFDAVTFPAKTKADTPYSSQEIEPETLSTTELENPRSGVIAGVYQDACENLAQTIAGKTVRHMAHKGIQSGSILVVGTEECMYPALMTGACLEQSLPQFQVRFHATTRSPICPQHTNDYPLFSRVRLRSCYDKDRTTFLYNLCTYACVVILTDTPLSQAQGLCDLYGALAQAGNQEILTFRINEQNTQPDISHQDNIKQEVCK